ncbi:hypothetical protein D3C71_1381140 [compost metagenome]
MKLAVQFYQLAEAVPAIVECCAFGVLALLNQPGFVVVPGGALAQGVGVAEQAAFGVADFEAGRGTSGATKPVPVTSGC